MACAIRLFHCSCTSSAKRALRGSKSHGLHPQLSELSLDCIDEKSAAMSSSGHRHAEITATDHGPLVNVASWILMVTSILFTGFRIVSNIFIRGRSGKDDWIIMLATVVAAAQSIATSLMVANGLGQHQDTLDHATLRGYQKVERLDCGLGGETLIWDRRHFSPVRRSTSPPSPSASSQYWCS